MRKIWPFTFYFWQYAGVAFVASFTVLYYQSLNFSGAQIGLLTGLSPLLTLFSAPLWTGLADATRRHRLILSVTMLGGSLFIFLIPFLSGFAAILLVGSVFSIFTAPVPSLADNATMRMLEGEKNLYGRVRLGGTLGFALAAPIAGWLVQDQGLKMAFWGCALMYFLAFLTSQKFAHTTTKSESEQQISLLSAARTLLVNPRWQLFLFAALAGGLGLAMSNNYFFPYMKELGASESTMGWALTIGTIGEVPVLFFGNRLLKRWPGYRLFILALVITGLRLILFGIASSPTQALFIQLLNGASFPMMWMAGVSFVDANAPAGMSASAQGLFTAMMVGVGMATGGFLGGMLLGSIGARAACLVFGIIVLVMVASALLAETRLPKQQVV